MIRALLALPLMGLLYDCAVPHEDYVWNQKTTVTVETPDGTASGSAVVQVVATFYEDGQLVSGREVLYGYRGEAAAVEVLPDQWLFALIGEPAELIYHASPDALGGIPRHDRGAWLAAIPGHEGEVTLTDGALPRLVTFADIDDPATVTLVDPENLAASFGPGVRLASVTLEVTDDAVTEGDIQNAFDYFWWEPDRREAYSCEAYRCGLSPVRFSLPDGRTDALTKRDFSREREQ